MKKQIRKRWMAILFVCALAAGSILSVAHAAERRGIRMFVEAEADAPKAGQENAEEEASEAIPPADKESTSSGDASGNAVEDDGTETKTDQADSKNLPNDKKDKTEQEEISVLEETADESSTMLEALETAENLPQVYASLDSGTTVIGKAGWTYSPGDADMEPTHMGFSFREGISECVPFHDGGDVTVSTVEDQAPRYQLHPNDNSSMGKFGVVYKNVGFDGTFWYDLKCTVSSYSTSVQATNGTVAVRPAISFSKSGIDFMTNMTNMQMAVRFDVLRSDTGASAGRDIRFQLRDIDLQQRFGLSLGDGQITKKYYFSNESVVYVDSETAFGHSFETYIGHSGQIPDPSDWKSRVCFEANSCSCFYLLFGPLDKDNNHPKAYYRAIEAGGKAGERSVSFDGEEYYVANELLELIEVDNPISPMPAPEKYISKDGSSWTKGSVALGSDTSEFYYRIRQYVPWQSDANRYSAFSVSDTLPLGVDYVSLVGITSGSKGSFADKFHIGVENQGTSSEKLTITAKDASSSSFAGNTYEFTFKVRMDPTETTPTYNGNSATYQVVNKASVSHVHKNHPTTQETNSVTAAASVKRPTPAAPTKGIGKDAARISYTAAQRTENITYSVFQTMPAYVHAFDADSTITMTDVLEPCWTYRSAAVYLDSTKLSSGWSMSSNGRTVTITGTNSPSYSGKTLRFDITVSLDKDYDMAAYRSVDNGTVIDTILNTAKVGFRYPKASSRTEEKSTNTVQVIFRENAVNLIVRKSDADTGENIPDAAFTVYEWDGSSYSKSLGSMDYDAASQSYRMPYLVQTPSNAGKFKVVETTTPHGYTGAWEQEIAIEDLAAGATKDLSYSPTNPTPRGTITIYKKNELGGLLEGAVFEIRAAEDITSPQGRVLEGAGTLVDTVTTGNNGKAVSRELYLGHYTVTETAAPAGYAISERPQEAVLAYKDKSTAKLNKDLTFIDSIAAIHLRLTKEIDTTDIVWAHGNPTFTFKVKGTDLCGRTHTYYEAVEFTEENTGNGRTSRLTADILVPSGTWTATEEATMRYRLDQIRDITNGRLEGGTAVLFNLTRGVDGAATFHNAKTTDENLSHTAFVRNAIGTE